MQYFVSKSTAVIGHFSDCMRRELAPDNVHITCSFPTATDTDMMQKFEDRKMDAPAYVAKRSLDALLNKELQVVFGGQEREDHVALNFHDRKKFDVIVAENYEARRASSAGHKAL
jgi:short-subunit dehydrogenase